MRAGAIAEFTVVNALKAVGRSRSITYGFSSDVFSFYIIRILSEGFLSATSELSLCENVALLPECSVHRRKS